LSVTEKSQHRALRNHNAHRLGHSTHVGGGNVTLASPRGTSTCAAPASR
jgi:hypothetical protein